MDAHFEPRISKVLADQILFDDFTYLLSPLPLEKMADKSINSIKRIGLLNPPVLKEVAPRSFQVVSGWKRLTAIFKELHAHSCPCLIWPDQTPEPFMLSVALEALSIKRSPSIIEQAVFCKKMLDCIDDHLLIHEFLPQLGRRANSYQLQYLLRFLQLEEPLILAMHSGFLDEHAAAELLDLPFPDRLALFDLIEYLQFSVSNQRKLIQICRELAMRQSTSIVNILADHDTKKIIEHPNANPPQKTHNLMRRLMDLRHPHLTKAEKEFDEFTKGLGLPGKAFISHAPSFEKDEVTLSLPFADQQQLAAVWPAIKKIIHQ